MMHKLVLLFMFTIIIGCAPKVNNSFTLPIPITYDEERMVHDKYPIEPVEVRELNETN